MLLLPMLYRLMRCLLGLATVLMRRDLSKDAELLVLRQSTTVHRRCRFATTASAPGVPSGCSRGACGAGNEARSGRDGPGCDTVDFNTRALSAGWCGLARE